MKPYHEERNVQIYLGDALEVLKTFDSEMIDCVITSPPYWRLRDYGVDGQIGLEKTFEEYIEKLCSVFDEVKRVLKKEGTCWVNLGDTYAGTMPKTENDYGANSKVSAGRKIRLAGTKNCGINDKSLCQIPSRFAIEMCNRKWILRNEIIWHKPNCMPSSVRDRFTIDFEKVFFFTKNKKYYFEQQKEGNSYYKTIARAGQKRFGGNNTLGTPAIRDSRIIETWGRNKRCVWKITTSPFKEAHFATFPEKLVEPMILSGCLKNGTVLDPFTGSGTTLKVARELGRKSVGIELNESYCEMAKNRTSQQLLELCTK